MSRRNEVRDQYLTTNQGAPITNDKNSLTVGDNGPVLLKDTNLIEKLAHFDRERIPDRVAHAKGSSAHGYFKLYNSMKDYTKAKVFTDIKNITPVIVRFSTVVGSKGSAETARDPRGFAVKFYTEEGNYDLVGNDIPVFFIRDSIKFPDMFHAFRPSPVTDLMDKNRFWDFIVNSPESTHMITWVFSDKGTRKSFIHMPGFGVNTFVWVNDKGKRMYVKYHWIPMAGDETIDRKEAEKLAGSDPDIATRELYDVLNNGEEVEYELAVQLMDPILEDSLSFNPIDATKVWPEDKFPLMKVGKLVLTHPPTNFFEESEQAAFAPGNFIPGIEASNCKLLQGRLFSYPDSQRYRLGTNFTQLPINKPKVPVVNNQRAGNMQYDKHSGIVDYNPNLLNDGNPEPAKEKGKVCLEYAEGYIERKPIEKEDDFQQAGAQYRSYNKIEREHLIDNIVNDLKEVDKRIQLKAIENFMKADKEFGTKVKLGLCLR